MGTLPAGPWARAIALALAPLLLALVLAPVASPDELSARQPTRETALAAGTLASRSPLPAAGPAASHQKADAEVAPVVPSPMATGREAPAAADDQNDGPELHSAVAAPLAQVPVPRPRYTLDLALDYDDARLSVQQTVVVPNTTGQVLESLVFHVAPAYFGSFALRSVRVDGRPIAAQLEDIVLELPLPAPLVSGASATVSFDYVLRVPRPGTLRFGVGQGVLALGNFYPVLAVWRGSDWDRHRYTDVGDAFFSDIADYEMTLRTAPHVAVAHSGELVAHGDGLWQIRAERARDVALALSHRYERQETTVDGIRLVAYYLPEHRAAAAEYLATGAPLLRWANASLGRYPYATLTIAETSSNDPLGVGQEYSGLVFIGTVATAAGAGRGGYLSYLVAHELLHQWFYGVVGSDQIREPWVDEAFATYLAYRFFADAFPDVYDAAWRRLVAAYEAQRARLADRPVNATIYDFAGDGDYFTVVYRRGALFLEELRTTLGDSRFRELLHAFVARYAFQTPRGTDFLDLAQRYTSADLAPLYRRYFAYARYDPARLDYPLASGWFFKQTNGQGGAGPTGYAVTDDGGARFWSTFQQAGGVPVFGYPISRRFVWDGFVVQAFQKAIFQWRPEERRVAYVNVLDLLSAAGKDDWLLAFRQTPRPFDHSVDATLPWEAVVARHLALLDAYPAIRARYLGEPQWLERYGLPVSAAEFDTVAVVRSQRAVFQQWRLDVPWARAGEVTVANGGELARDAGLLPAAALEPEAPPDGG